MREIAIKELGDLSELNTFIEETNDKAMTVKGLVVADHGDIKLISADIKELKQREDILKIAEGTLIKLAGIDRVGMTIANSREQRLLANKNVQNAKQEIKNKALDFFTSKASELIQNSKASDAYKQNFVISEMARDTIAGKSKDFMGLMKTELSNLELRLDNNARETSEKLINEILTIWCEIWGIWPIDTLKLELENRKTAKNNEIKAEAERLAKIEAEKID